MRACPGQHQHLVCGRSTGSHTCAMGVGGCTRNALHNWRVLTAVQRTPVTGQAGVGGTEQLPCLPVCFCICWRALEGLGFAWRAGSDVMMLTGVEVWLVE
jgi:hypothetical protein